MVKFDEDGDRHADIPKYRRSGTRAVVGAIFPARYLLNDELGKSVSFKNAFEEAFNHVLTYYKFVKRYRVFKIVETRRDLLLLFEKYKRMIGIVMGLEGAYPVRELDDLELFHRLGIRVLGLTWNVDNQYAASCMTENDYGLTNLGSRLVEKALEYGMVIDLAHASRKTMLDVLSIVEKPVMISHAGLRRYNDSPRNVDDDVLDMLKRNKGVFGLFFVSDFLSGDETTIDTIVEYMVYLRDNFGVDIIGIGSDYFGTSKLPKGLENIGLINNLVEKLIENGFSYEDVEKIFYKNALRVFLENMR